ncbi:MAG: glycosyltransferase family 4 protein [Candidatus Nanohaloarchaea archaeon]
MNILVISDAFWPQRTGGITKSLLTEVNELVENNHSVTIITRKIKEDTPLHETRGGYEVYRYKSPAKSSSFYHSYPLFSLTTLPRLIDRLHKNMGFDAAYVHNSFQALGLSRSSVDIPYIHTFHAPIPKEIKIHADRGKYGWKTPFVRLANRGFKLLENRAVHNSDTLLVRSQFMKQELEDLYGDVNNTKIVPLAVDTEKFSYSANPRTKREEIGLPEDRPILLTVRRLVARMGLENLVESMNFIKQSHPDALLVIGGKGYLRNKLESLIEENGLQDNIRLEGFIPEEDLPVYYQSADLFIMPTLELEGFGLSTIESLSCGTPVVATPVGANPEVVGSLDTDLICEGTNPVSLSETISNWLSKGFNEYLRKRCREYCETNYGKQQVVKNLELILTSIS